MITGNGKSVTNQAYLQYLARKQEEDEAKRHNKKNIGNNTLDTVSMLTGGRFSMSTIDSFSSGGVAFSSTKTLAPAMNSALNSAMYATLTTTVSAIADGMNIDTSTNALQQMLDASAQVSASANQTTTNMQQSDSVKQQLNLGRDDTWGVDSLAQDLAVFGMDFTVFNQDAESLVEQVNTKALSMLDDLEKDHRGAMSDFETRRNEITGAAARLVNGFKSAGALMSASAGLSSNTNVDIDGVRVNASAIVAVANIIVDPLALDLNGDGFNFSGSAEGVMFDMEGEGQQSRTGFIRGDDAFLFMDRNGDGVVNDGRELFGNSDGYANGFEKLRALDENGDGVIDENDSAYEHLRLWVEKREDGVCDEDEVMSLKDAGIASINVGYENTRVDDGKGNLIGQTGSFTRTDGTQGAAADVWLGKSAD